ncbi:MAG: DUF3232 domain-containing protein [Candidatus Paceibacterota bacterium]
MKEGFPKPPKAEVRERLHHNIEDVVVHATETRRECQLNPDSPGCEPELIHNEIENSELAGLYHNYEEHKIVKLSDLTGSIAKIAAHLEQELTKVDPESEEGQFITTQFNLLKTRDKEVRSSVQRYIRTLSKFYNLKKQRVRMEPEEFRYQMEEADRRRKAAHDALLDTLSIYSRILSQLQNEDYLEGFTVVMWKQGIELTDSAESEQTLFSFASLVLQDRDLVKDWAVTAHVCDELQLSREAKKNASTEGRELPDAD